MKQAALTGLGFSPYQALAMSGAGEQGLTATGTNQATALLVSGHFAAFTTVAASTGCVLAAAFKPGDEVYIFNGGANTLTIYPNGSDTIDNTTSQTIVTLKGIRLVCTSVAAGVQAWTSHKST